VKRKEKIRSSAMMKTELLEIKRGSLFFLGRFLKMDVVGREVVGDSWVLPCLQAVEWSEVCEHCVEREREKQKETSKHRWKTYSRRLQYSSRKLRHFTNTKLDD